MRRLSTAIVAATLMVAMLHVGAPAAHAARGTTVSRYLALGDSMAAGFQPNQGLTDGYVGRVWHNFRRQVPGLSLRNLACPGETTRAMITGKQSGCHYGAGSQLDAAVAFLGAHPGEVEFITITLGGNDLIFQCLDGRTWLMTRACAADVRPGIRSRLASILDALGAAAPGVPIVGETYHDPFLGLWGLIPGGYKKAHSDHRAMTVLNAGLAKAYGDAGAAVADVATTFQIDDWTHTVVVPGRGRLPLNVANACNWTWFCSPKWGGDPHPNNTGYKKVANTFNREIDALLP